MRKVLLIAASALLVSTPPALAGMFSQSRGDSGKDRVVCKSRQATGTRFGSRVCRTVEQWEQISENAKRDAAEAINRPAVETRRE